MTLHDDIGMVKERLSSYPIHTRERWARLLTALEDVLKRNLIPLSVVQRLEKDLNEE